MNKSRDFTKIACVRSRDFSGQDQSSVTMADKDKDVDVSEAIMSPSPVTVHGVVIGGVSPLKTTPCLLDYHAYMYLCACMFLCVCLAVKYYLILLTSSSGGTEPGSILLAAKNCLGT